LMTQPRRDEDAPLRVLHVLASSQPGGTETNVLRLATAGSPQLCHHVLFLAPSGPISEQLSQANVPVTLAPGSGPLAALRAARAFRRLVKREAFDVVLIYGLRANTIGRTVCHLSRTRAAVLGGLRSLYPSGHKANWTLWLDRLTFRWSMGYISNSEAAVEHLVSHGYPRRKFWVIRQGVDLSRFAPAGAEVRERLRSTFDVPDGCPVLSCVANLRPVKDHETLLRALALVKQRGIPFRALLAGDGPLRFALEDVAASLDLSEEVRFLGQLAGDDVAHLFQATDIALLTSRVEGLPTALLEAMACGCAVVATDVGGTAELVEHGATGLLVEPGNVEAVATAVEDLLRHPARLDEMRSAARRRVEERFSLDRMIEEYESLLARLSHREV